MPVSLALQTLVDSVAGAVADTVAGALADTAAADTVAARAAAPMPALPAALTATDLLAAGGWALALVAAAAVWAVVSVVGALRSLRDAGADGDEIIRTVASYIRAGNLVGAVDFCRSQDSVAARVVSEGVQRLGRPIGDIQTAVAAAARREQVRLTGALDAVRSAALVSGLAGVLGTATGAMALLHRGTAPAALWPALLPAAVGAGVGLLLVGLYHAVAGRAGDAAAALDTLTGDFLTMLRAPAETR